MISVPTSRNPAPAAAPGPALPPEPFLMMAAAQMHKEGRLVQSQYSEPDTTGGKPPANQKAPPPEEYFPSNGQRNGPAMMAKR